MNSRILSGVILMILSCTAWAWGADNLDDVERKLSQQAGKYKTVSIRVKQWSIIETPMFTMEDTEEATMETTQQGDKWLLRCDTQGTTRSRSKDEPDQNNEYRKLQIDDGAFMWKLSTSLGAQTAEKAQSTQKKAVNPFDPKPLFTTLREDFDPRLLPDEKVEGRAVYVVEGTAKKDEAARRRTSPIQRIVMYFDQESGVPVQQVNYNKAGKAILKSTITELRLNAALGPERFVFKAPPGVKVVDKTGIRQ